MKNYFIKFKACCKNGVKRTPNNKVCLFRGILYCSKCGHGLSQRIDSRTACKTVRYICWHSGKFKVGISERCCTNKKNIREDYIEQYLLSNIKEEAKKFIIKNKEVKNIIKVVDNSVEINRLNKN